MGYKIDFTGILVMDGENSIGEIVRGCRIDTMKEFRERCLELQEMVLKVCCGNLL